MTRGGLLAGSQPGSCEAAPPAETFAPSTVVDQKLCALLRRVWVDGSTAGEPLASISVPFCSAYFLRLPGQW